MPAISFSDPQVKDILSSMPLHTTLEFELETVGNYNVTRMPFGWLYQKEGETCCHFFVHEDRSLINTTANYKADIYPVGGGA